MDNTIIQQGRFTQGATATDKIIQLRSDVDWMKVYNITVAAGAQTTAIGVEYLWLRGFPAGAQWIYKKSNAAAAADLSAYTTSGGFTLINTSENPNAALNNGSTGVSAVSNAAIPVATVGSTAGMTAGNIVRLYDVTGALQLGGIDFTVGYNTFSGTTFSLDYMSQIVAGTTGDFRVIKYDPLFYPRSRSITNITKASQAVVTLSVTHGYKVGQVVRMVVPEAYGMVEMNGLQGTIVAINTTTTSGNTITLDIDSSSFTTFAFPLTAAYPFSKAEVTPIGEDTAEALSAGVDTLSDATVNTGYIGIKLTAGANSPAGQASDVVYWVAGKSFSVDNN